ncbi:hypothetical protein AVDCRST_MAG94-5610 [uncultured Leptolyngbya sp.]|uniref:SH3b domain-containing protein n=1 Tax=uncultured Leptolyngbya sp. TaxID=332963 RepID=A0A6J4NQ98_9CYAN|nr:hypothetical protein AVDCRST_MAG94-5610 [uncultured Leptolyngbya sp.]
MQILDSAQDSGGYTWYKVKIPKSGIQGWIAAQLIEQVDTVPVSQRESPAPTSQVIPATSGTNNSGGSGRCDKPDDLDAAGKRCGRRAASKRAGGR